MSTSDGAGDQRRLRLHVDARDRPRVAARVRGRRFRRRRADVSLQGVRGVQGGPARDARRPAAADRDGARGADQPSRSRSTASPASRPTTSSARSRASPRSAATRSPSSRATSTASSSSPNRSRRWCRGAASPTRSSTDPTRSASATASSRRSSSTSRRCAATRPTTSPACPASATRRRPSSCRTSASVEALLERVDELPEGRLKTSIKANADQIRLGKRMVTIVRDVPVELDLERARWTRYDYDKVRDVFDRLEFRQLLSRFPPPDQVPVQPSLTFEPAPAAGRAEDRRGSDRGRQPARRLRRRRRLRLHRGRRAWRRGSVGLGVSTGRRHLLRRAARRRWTRSRARSPAGRSRGHDAKETELALALARRRQARVGVQHLSRRLPARRRLARPAPRGPRA